MRRRPLNLVLVRGMQRLQIFSAALVEALLTQQLEKQGVSIKPGGSIGFQEKRDQAVLNCLIQLSEVFPKQLEGSDFPSTLLLALWLAECRVSPLGALLEGEVGMPYPVPGKPAVYKAAFPMCLYPATCLCCGNPIKGKRDKFCRQNCDGSWTTLKEQFTRISRHASSPHSLLDEYGAVFNAYCLFIDNPHYMDYQYRDPGRQKQIEVAEKQGLIGFYRDKKGQPVDLQGNHLPQACLITDVEDILD